MSRGAHINSLYRFEPERARVLHVRVYWRMCPRLFPASSSRGDNRYTRPRGYRLDGVPTRGRRGGNGGSPGHDICKQKPILGTIFERRTLDNNEHTIYVHDKYTIQRQRIINYNIPSRTFRIRLGRTREMRDLRFIYIPRDIRRRRVRTDAINC